MPLTLETFVITLPFIASNVEISGFLGWGGLVGKHVLAFWLVS